MQERTGHAWGEGGGGHAMPRKGGKRCETPARAAAKDRRLGSSENEFWL